MILNSYDCLTSFLQIDKSHDDISNDFVETIGHRMACCVIGQVDKPEDHDFDAHAEHE